MEILAVKNLSFTYPLAERAALQDVCFTVQKGELVVLCGATGSGKSTLLQLLKPELSPNGTRTGIIRFRGEMPEKLSPRESAAHIGYVMQHPEQQIVTDKVWHELAFGLENLGTPKEVIGRRIAEMVSYFGIGSWYQQDTASLSGGQKQLLNLAAVMVMQPEVLILDEPTAQLDPIAAADFLATVRRLHQELGLTVLLAEHRLEEAVTFCDRLFVMEEGRLLTAGAPRELILQLRKRPELLYAMPAAAQLYVRLEASGSCPLTVREGRDYIISHFTNATDSLPEETEKFSAEPALTFREVCFRYERHLPDVLNGLSLTVYTGELFCICGANGSGKSTALKAAANLLKIYSGSIQVFSKKLSAYRGNALYQHCLAYLPQDVQTMFLKQTVREELEEAGAELAQLPFDAEKLLQQHPYDLSGGEQQLTALAKVLAAKPKLLLLDEPTKGIDAAAKRKLAEILRHLKQQGMTLVVVTHDVEFAAAVADRCAMFFQGRIVSVGTPKAFFSENSFYTTAVSRMTRGYFRNAVTVEDAAALCQQNCRKEVQDAAHQTAGNPADD